MPEHREKRGKRRIIAPVLGIIIFIIIIAAIASILGSNAPVKPIITSTIELRATDEPIKRSQLISNLDSYMAQAANPVLTEQWNKVISCLGQGCPDEAFSDTIFIVCSEFRKDTPNCELIMHLTAINKFWNEPERVLEFSKSMTTTDKIISDSGNRRIIKTWNDLVKCNGKCAEKNDLFFKLIDEIIKYA